MYLLWTSACSTRVLRSEAGVPAEFWLITDRNLSSSLVLSVFPAPLSPLRKPGREPSVKKKTTEPSRRPSHLHDRRLT